MSPVVMNAIKEDEKEHSEELASRIQGVTVRNPNKWAELAHCKYIEAPEELTNLKAFCKMLWKAKDAQ